MEWILVLQSTLILFAIVNPVGSIPIFLQLTRGMSVESRRKAFRTAVITSALILFVFILAGKWILTYFFQIQLPDLMAAGGLLLLIIAIDQLVFGTLVKSVTASQKEDAHKIGAVPIACPILAGPGAMMTAFVTYSEHGFLVAAAAIVIVLGITWLLLYFIDKLYKFLGEVVCLVLSKILSLFLAAIGIRLLMQGLSQYFR
ncbi:MAG: MarC family protein [Candidatus Omnitrophica bacterium]|nr:MarC family protein [Candidatus Omnitrophota bacterium]